MLSGWNLLLPIMFLVFASYKSLRASSAYCIYLEYVMTLGRHIFHGKNYHGISPSLLRRVPIYLVQVGLICQSMIRTLRVFFYIFKVLQIYGIQYGESFVRLTLYKKVWCHKQVFRTYDDEKYKEKYDCYKYSRDSYISKIIEKAVFKHIFWLAYIKKLLL